MLASLYKIANSDESIVYIGSTILSLDYRWRLHKNEYKRWMDGKKKHCSAMIYHSFKELGVDAFSISLISEHDVENRTQMHQLEQDVIDSTACCNKNKAYQSLSQEDYHKQYSKWYREHNSDKINAKTTCSCGLTIYKRYKSQHIKTRKHKKRLEAL